MNAEVCSSKIQIGGAQRDRQVRRQRAGDAEAPRRIDYAVDADFVGQLHGGHVARSGQRAPQRNHAFVFFVVVVRRVGWPPLIDREGRVQDRVEGREALLQSRRINVDLERAAHLALGLRRRD